MNNYPCTICKTETSPEWTCRGGNWLCAKCTKIPMAVFFNHDAVVVALVGGPADGQRITVPNHILSTGYRVATQDHPHSTEYHYENYKFDWNLGFFIFEKNCEV